MTMSSALAALLALAATATTTANAAQPGRDPTTFARDAYTACLRQFMQASLRERMAQAAFDAAIPQQCANELAAYRAAVITREVGFRTPRAEAEQTATQEVDDARANLRELYAMNSTPR